MGQEPRSKDLLIIPDVLKGSVIIMEQQLGHTGSIYTGFPGERAFQVLYGLCAQVTFAPIETCAWE